MMMNDTELDQATADLEVIRSLNERHAKYQLDLFEKYAQLVDSYRRLKSDYEEERESRERYKQLARGQERNPFVLVLVDGDGYHFHDDLISDRMTGGSRAAQLLNDSIRSILRSRGLDHCRVMVRVYANLAGLSKAMHMNTRLCGAEKRSLAPFAADFNRSNDLFDFVDAGEIRKNADSKIRAVFRQFVDNAQCKHIFFAACHGVGFLSDVRPYASNPDRITLIRNHGAHPEFTKLGLRMEDLPNIFRSIPLEVSASPYSRPTTAGGYASPPAPTKHKDAIICTFFWNKGKCARGRACKFQHVKPDGRGNEEKAPSPSPIPHLVKNDDDLTRVSSRTSTVQVKLEEAELPASLPREEDIPPGKIPINADQQRLDPCLPKVTREESAAFGARSAKRKLCNSFHLGGICNDAFECPYDHSEATPAELACLKGLARSLPCGRRGACRNLDCIQGHICQREDCRHRGGKHPCKFSYVVHFMDLSVAEYVDPTGGPIKKISVPSVWFNHNHTNESESDDDVLEIEDGDR